LKSKKASGVKQNQLCTRPKRQSADLQITSKLKNNTEQLAQVSSSGLCQPWLICGLYLPIKTQAGWGSLPF